jgi:predicted dehydrogenase
MTETFIKERKLQDEPHKVKPVTIDDACAFLTRFENGALGTFESTRYARGRKNQNTFEVNGEKGSVAFDLENAHQLCYYDYGDESHVRGWRTIQVWDADHPYMKHWWVPGCAIGYEHTFINALADFLSGLETGKKMCPDFKDALATQYVCDAVLASAKNKKWETVKQP